MSQRLLLAREAVWRAWFGNGQAKLEQLIPAEVITIESGAEAWGNRASVLAGAKKFAESGGKLVRLEFPRTERQVYGSTVIIENNGKRKISSGRATDLDKLYIDGVKARHDGYIPNELEGVATSTRSHYITGGYVSAAMYKAGYDQGRFQKYNIRMDFYFGPDEWLKNYNLQTLADQ
jgi:hypothetical protein